MSIYAYVALHVKTIIFYVIEYSLRKCTLKVVQTLTNHKCITKNNFLESPVYFIIGMFAINVTLKNERTLT